MSLFSSIGIRSIIGSQVVIGDSVLMGADHYETDDQRAENRELGRPDIGMTVPSLRVARKGFVIIPKSAIIPDGAAI